MRTLNITRIKKFTGCLATLKVYIEDQISSELTICDVPCRKLGDLKNGATVSYQVEDSAAKIFVIADQSSKNICFDCYQLNNGFDGETVTLTGYCHFNLATGNAFRFDNNTNSAALAVRKKRKINWGLVVGIVLVCVVNGIVIAHMLKPKQRNEMDFGVYNMNITLDDRFAVFEDEYVDLFVSFENVGVYVVRYPFADYPDFKKYTVAGFADMFKEMNGDMALPLKIEDGLTWYEYNFEEDGGEEYYFTYFYKSSDAFWIVQFGTYTKYVEKYHEDIVKWAKTVKFN